MHLLGDGRPLAADGAHSGKSLPLALGALGRPLVALVLKRVARPTRANMEHASVSQISAHGAYLLERAV